MDGQTHAQKVTKLSHRYCGGLEDRVCTKGWAKDQVCTVGGGGGGGEDREGSLKVTI